MLKNPATFLPFAALILAAPAMAQTDPAPAAPVAPTAPASAPAAATDTQTITATETVTLPDNPPAAPAAAETPVAPAAPPAPAADVTPPPVAEAPAAPPAEPLPAGSYHWTLAGSDASGAMAYADPGDGTLIAVMRVAQPAQLDDVAQYSGLAIILKPDCAAMTKTVVDMTYYAADKTVISSRSSNGQAQPIKTDSLRGPDNLATAKCQGNPLPQGDTFTGDEMAVQDWLDGAIAKNTPPAS